MKGENEKDQDQLDPSAVDPENEKSKKTKGDSKKSDKKSKSPLPLLLEFVFTISIVLLILADLTIAIISFTSGAHLIDIALRTGVTTLVLGVLFWLLSSRFYRGVIQAVYASISNDNPGNSANKFTNDFNDNIEA